MWSVEFQVSGEECKVQSVKCGKCRVWSEESKV